MPPEWFDTTNAPPADGHGVHAAHLGRKYRLMSGPHDIFHLLSEGRIPLRGFFVVEFLDVLNAVVAHDVPSK